MSRIPPTRGPSLEVFGETMRRQVAAIGERFTKPDDDWLPCLLHLETKSHQHRVAMVEPKLLAPETKDALFAGLVEYLRQNEAIRYGILVNGWALAVQPREGEELAEASKRLMAETEEWTGHYGEHPDRIEVLTIELVDQERAESWQARIMRYPDRPPKLQPWERLGDETSGRMTWLRAALWGEES